MRIKHKDGELDLGDWHTMKLLARQNDAPVETLARDYFFGDIEFQILGDCAKASPLLCILAATGGFVLPFNRNLALLKEEDPYED